MSDTNENSQDNFSIAIDFEQIEEVSRVFFEESRGILEAIDPLILDLEKDPSDSAVVNNLFRRVHTLKGSAGSVPGGQLLGSLAHEFEALLSKIKKEKKAATKECIDLFLHSTRLLKILAQALREQSEILPEVLSEVIELITQYGQIDLQTAAASAETRAGEIVPRKTVAAADSSQDGIWMNQDQLMNMMKISGEILVLKNHFQMMAQTGDYKTRQLEFNQSLVKISDQFQSQLAKVMKVQASECLKTLPTLVRQVSTELNKEVQFQAAGLDLWVDKNLGRDINEVLLHLIRNSIDHGLEDPFDRTTLGKPSAGQLKLELSEKNNFVVVDFKDDGKGLDRERLLSKAIEKNLVGPEDGRRMTDQKIFEFIFHPGFSTKEKISTISGRGVGMDVVSSIVQKYKGQIRVESVVNQGLHIQMEFAVPQHMMMESVILCSWQDTQIAIPIAQLLQIQSASELHLTEVEQIRFCQWSERTVPVLNYDEFVQRRMNADDDSFVTKTVLFLRHQHHVIGLVADRIEGQVDLMVRPFGKIIQSLPGFRGTAILADDKVTFILDPEKLIRMLERPELEESATLRDGQKKLFPGDSEAA